MDLTFAIFSSAWLLGWSIAPFLMTIVIVLCFLAVRSFERVKDG
jgi:hypothetical protein